ncbi:MAG: universal stress protein [Vicinamibacterales bacterium]
MKTVLVPVDGSESATRAVEWVARVLPGAADARVHLVNVQPSVDAWEVRSHLGEDDIAKFHENSSKSVLDPAVEVLRAAGLPVEVHALVGEIAEQIAAAVASTGADSVVMGTRGLGRIQSLLVGSTAMKVIHLVDVPVTLIK